MRWASGAAKSTSVCREEELGSDADAQIREFFQNLGDQVLEVILIEFLRQKRPVPGDWGVRRGKRQLKVQMITSSVPFRPYWQRREPLA